MKRRHFVKTFGQGLSSSILLPEIFQTGDARSRDFGFTYPIPENLDEAKNDEGLIALRLEILGNSEVLGERLKGEIQGRKLKIVRGKVYFTFGDNVIDLKSHRFDVSATRGDRHIIALWLKDVTTSSQIICRVNGQKITIGLGSILPGNQFERESGLFALRANVLFHHEVGSISPSDVHIQEDLGQFRFIIMADPQGGDPCYENHGSNARMKIHNAFIEESILSANSLDPQPVFALVLGDFTDRQGEEENFRQMIRYFDKLNMPVLLEIGNHETRYRSMFTPGYNMSEFRNYFAAQKSMNGLQKLVYSFDLGEWHFIVWPDPLRDNFWETHPHYFDWLERDLESHRDKPTFFFQHVPMHPIGINPLVSYVNPVHINRLMFDILGRYGNVKYVFSGHVHIPLRSSLKTAVTYRGINFINLPPAGYRPRAFGEEDLYGGPTQGFCVMDIKKGGVEVTFKTVTREIFRYPASFSPYLPDSDPLWFSYKWEMDCAPELVNGNFKDGLKGWMQPFVYMEDERPSNLCEVRTSPDGPGNALYMYSRKRDYDKPGQDRLPQTLNQLTQVVRAGAKPMPLIRFEYMVDEAHFNPESWNGAFLWVEGFHQNHLILNQVYAIGRTHRSLGGSYSNSPFTGYSYFDIYDGSPGWNRVSISIGNDFNRLDNGKQFQDLPLEKLALNFGVWTINEGYRQSAGIYYRDIILEFSDRGDSVPGLLNGSEYRFLDKEKIWDRGITHVAGEHRYVIQEEVYPY